MNPCVPVVHITHREGMAAVFMSQVARPMSLVQARGYRVTLVVFSPLGEYLRTGPRRQWRQRSETIEREFGLKVRRIPSPPSRARWLWDDALFLRAWLRQRHWKSEQVILHCRGTHAAHVALRASHGDARFRVALDCRGLDGAEFLYVQGCRSLEDAPQRIRREAEARDHSQRLAAQGSQAMICVSESMKRRVVRTWSVQPDKVRVIPCCADIDTGASAVAGRVAMRRRLGLDSRFLVTYCGSLLPWQMPMQSFAIFRVIAKIRSDAHFLAVTTQPGQMEEAAEIAGVKAAQRTIVSVPHSEVPGYLAAGDVGLLLRDASPVNRVASPVKFAEYLACGLPIILTEGVGDYSALVQRKGIGCVLPHLNASRDLHAALSCFLERYQNSFHALRKQCTASARRSLGWNTAIKTFYALYSELLTR